MYHTIEQVNEFAGDLSSSEQLPTSKDPEFNSLRDKINSVLTKFHDDMDDDFNTAAALGQLFDLSRALNRFQDSRSRKPTREEKKLLAQGMHRLRECANVLGLLQRSPEEFFRDQRQMLLAKLGIDEEEVEGLIAERVQARKVKDWARADEIRDKLAEMSIIVEDKPEGTRWRVKTASE